MVRGSHNTWSYLTPVKWWMRLIAFTARCQRKVPSAQYTCYNIRCFDLRIRFDKNDRPIIVHGPIEYGTAEYAEADLYCLNHLKNSGYVRVILDLRTRKARKDADHQIGLFQMYCSMLEIRYPSIRFWCGRMLPMWVTVHSFTNSPSCEECYGSVTKPKWLWGWWPWLYARIHNKGVIERGTDRDILLMDYIDIK